MDYCILLLNEINEILYISIIFEDKKKIKVIFLKNY